MEKLGKKVGAKFDTVEMYGYPCICSSCGCDSAPAGYTDMYVMGDQLLTDDHYHTK